MKIVAIILFCISVAHAYPDKDKEIESFIFMQQQIFEIAKRHHENPFLDGTSNLNHAVESELKKLNFAQLSSMQLYRLGIACSLASYPQKAGDERWDLVFDAVSWKCVQILASRPGYEAAHYLRGMKKVFGTDGSASLIFKNFIEQQSKLQR